jgi:two-component system, sensor histidine kinase YesM
MPKLKMNTFSKMLVLVVFLLLPVIGLYAASNRISMNVVHDEVQSLKAKDLHFYANQVDNSVGLLSTLALLLSEDMNIRELQNMNLFYNTYERNQAILRLFERLRLLNMSTGWNTHISVYSMESKQVISTNNSVSYEEEYLRDNLSLNWTINQNKYFYSGSDRFMKHIVQPLNFGGKLENAGIIVELSFSKDELIRSLDTFKQGGKGDPFFYKPGFSPILNHSSDDGLIGQLLSSAAFGSNWDQITNKNVTLGDKAYLLNVVHIPSIDWYLVDYEPIGEILKPIVKSRNLFYLAIGTQLVLGSIAAFFLYQQVQVPIKVLMKGLQIIKKGDYSTRIRMKPNNEFAYLFDRFNDMSEEIQNLVQKVYVEELRSREANLKQLQSQINPHFLYNCFALIRSLTRLGEKESVMELAMHLSKYYRYTTRVEKLSSTLQEELQLITSYLEIQKLHLQRLSYEFHIPEGMMQLEIPRLLLQPLVENAVIHGIEPMLDHGHITVTGSQSETENIITVTDNGVGLTHDAELKLRQSLLYPPDDETGCALWNIRQRIKLSFGTRAEMDFVTMEPRGLCVRIRWSNEPQA